jgi:hypothetical protein
VLYWFSSFESSVTFVEETSCSGCPSATQALRNVAQMSELFNENTHLAVIRLIWNVAEYFRTSKKDQTSSCQFEVHADSFSDMHGNVVLKSLYRDQL